MCGVLFPLARELSRGFSELASGKCGSWRGLQRLQRVLERRKPSLQPLGDRLLVGRPMRFFQAMGGRLDVAKGPDVGEAQA